MTKTVLEYPDGTQGLVATNHYNQHGTPYAEFRFLGTEGTLEGTIGLMYDYPNGRPDTLALYREGEEVQAFELDTKWLPDAFLGPMSDLMDAIATGRAAGHRGSRDAAHAGHRRGGLPLSRGAPQRAPVRDHRRRRRDRTRRCRTPARSSRCCIAPSAMPRWRRSSPRTATVESWLRTEAALARAQAGVGELAPTALTPSPAPARSRTSTCPALWAEMANVGYPILPAGPPGHRAAARAPSAVRSTTAPPRRTSWTPG